MEHRFILGTTTTRLHFRQTAWFAENFDEYGLVTSANNRQKRHRFGTELFLHAQPAYQEASGKNGFVCNQLAHKKRNELTKRAV